jgi:DNA-binding transcriptional ArsR family regulator
MKDVSQSLLSHHLADLRAADMVVSEKRGLKVYYKLTEQGMKITNRVLAIQQGVADEN